MHVRVRRALFLFLIFAALTSAASGIFGRMPAQFSAMFALMPVFALLGFVFEDPARKKTRGVRVAEVIVGVVVGACSLTLAIYGFLGLF